MKRICLSAFFCVMIFAAHAQKIDTAKTVDSVYVPLRYCDINKRSPILACFLSAYIPGLGQVYNKQIGKGAIVFGTVVLSFDAAEIYHGSHPVNPYTPAGRPHDAVTGALLMPMAAAWVYSIIDAPVTSIRLNKTYHLGKKKQSLTAFSIQPGIINSSPDHYSVGFSLVLR